jgi:hypothetical protein
MHRIPYFNFTFSVQRSTKKATGSAHQGFKRKKDILKGGMEPDPDAHARKTTRWVMPLQA